MTLKYSKRERTSKINESERVCQSNLGTVWILYDFVFMPIESDWHIFWTSVTSVTSVSVIPDRSGRHSTISVALAAGAPPWWQRHFYRHEPNLADNLRPLQYSQQFRNSFATISQICTMHFCISGSVRFFPAFLSSSVLRVSSSMLKCVPKESVARDGGSTVQRTLWTLQTFNILTDLGTDAARCLPNF